MQQQTLMCRLKNIRVYIKICTHHIKSFLIKIILFKSLNYHNWDLKEKINKKNMFKDNT